MTREIMATIVDIRSASRDSASTRNQSRNGGEPRSGSAEILLFTGIRYERWGDLPARPTVRQACKRDRLELED
ncbi:MAG: hypothetical protein C0511_14560 [Hyphomicrobium sp.]|nr:hypothetical protein [Hyphomicrobium sp.]